MRSLHRQVDEAGIWTQSARFSVFLLVVFYGKTFNVKLCTLHLYSGFILFLYKIDIINKVSTESRLLISVFYYIITWCNLRKIAGGQWRKALFSPPGGRSYKGDVTWKQSIGIAQFLLLLQNESLFWGLKHAWKHTKSGKHLHLIMFSEVGVANGSIAPPIIFQRRAPRAMFHIHVHNSVDTCNTPIPTKKSHEVRTQQEVCYFEFSL